MKEENLESLFRELKGSFDTEEPRQGHQSRFLEKLEAGRALANKRNVHRKVWWKPLAIAASVALLCLLGIRFFAPGPTVDERVAQISPEISKTEFYFASLIEEQINELENEATPETQQLVSDTMIQLQKLEANYKNLESDLLKGGNSKLILSAMITNFQTRIDLLQEVMQKIDTIKNLNSYDDENYTI
jgi:hypothetical protein